MTRDSRDFLYRHCSGWAVVESPRYLVYRSSTMMKSWNEKHHEAPGPRADVLGVNRGLSAKRQPALTPSPSPRFQVISCSVATSSTSTAIIKFSACFISLSESFGPLVLDILWSTWFEFLGSILQVFSPFLLLTFEYIFTTISHLPLPVAFYIAYLVICIQYLDMYFESR